MTDVELAYRVGELFNKKITAYFWDSFRGEYGRTQVEVLVYLHDYKQATASELISATGVSKQHISKVIKNFSEDGLVVSQPCAADMRVSVLSLSERGKEFLQKHYDASFDYFEKIMGKMLPDQKQRFRNAMMQMEDILSKL